MGYLILAESKKTKKKYTYGHIVPWLFRKRLEKACRILNSNAEFNPDITFKVISEKAYKSYNKMFPNYTDPTKLIINDFFDSMCYNKVLIS